MEFCVPWFQSCCFWASVRFGCLMALNISSDCLRLRVSYFCENSLIFLTAPIVKAYSSLSLVTLASYCFRVNSALVSASFITAGANWESFSFSFSASSSFAFKYPISAALLTSLVWMMLLRLSVAWRWSLRWSSSSFWCSVRAWRCDTPVRTLAATPAMKMVDHQNLWDSPFSNLIATKTLATAMSSGSATTM